MTNGRIIVFTCNWDAYSAMECAGRQGLPYPAAVVPVRVPCLGRLHSGFILKAFEQGAAGVLLLGCGNGQCHHQFGRRHAEETAASARELVRLLGYGQNAVAVETIAADNGRQWVRAVTAFTEQQMIPADES